MTPPVSQTCRGALRLAPPVNVWIIVGARGQSQDACSLLLVIEAAHLLRFRDGPFVILLFPLPGVFNNRSTESIVLQLRVVAGAPKNLSISPRYLIVLIWRR
jgi:hypothetical protein